MTRRLRLGALAGCTLASTIVGLGLYIANASVHGSALPGDVVLGLAWLALPLIGVVILFHRPHNRVGRILSAMGLLGGLGLLASNWAVFTLRANPGALPGGAAAAWLATWLFVPAVGLIPFLIAVFPEGRIESRWLHRFASVGVVALVLLAAAQAFASEALDGVPVGFAPITNPLGIDAVAPAVSVITTVTVICLVLLTIAAIADLAVRYRRSRGDLRLQLRWVATAFLVLPITFSIGIPLGMAGFMAASDVVLLAGQVMFLVGVGAALGVAVLRYRLYDLRLVLNRSLLYACLSLAALALYAGVVSVAAIVLRRGGMLPSVVGAATVAVAFQPLRDRLQAWADRRLYGRRRDPYDLVRGLGAELDAADLEAIPQVLTKTLARELKLPYVALESESASVVAEWGTPLEAPERIVIHHQGRALGALLVGVRQGTGGFSDAERLLLGELGRQVGAMLQAARATLDLQVARQRLVVAREEERRRIHRDLHDGLGPTLAGMTLQADVAKKLVRDDPDAAEVHLGELTRRLQAVS